MEITNNFIGGLHKDFDPQNQPKGTYTNLTNWIRQEDGSLLPERGTTELSIPTGYVVIGGEQVNDELILFLAGESSKIGKLDKNNTYSDILESSILDFKVDRPISSESRIDYRGHRIIYFVGKDYPIRRIDIDEIPTNLTDDELDLFLKYDTPEIKVNSVTENGSLPTGVYQFAVRLSTRSMNKTTFSIITNPISIVDDSISSGRDAYDGSLPQTPSNKAISLTISNIDKSFEYIEVVAITYEGTASQLSVHSLPLISINNSDSINVTYSSTEQNREAIEIDNLLQEIVNYSEAEHILQKDNVLLLSNLKSEINNLDLQSIANNVKLSYITKNLPYSEDVKPLHEGVQENGGMDTGSPIFQIEDYKNPLVAYNYKSYMRGEVYSFALVVKLKNQNISRAFHIPGNLTPTGNELEAFITSNEYPPNYGYPEGFVRHHRFPYNEKEPMINESQTQIKALGVKADIDLSSLNPEILSKIEYVGLVRQIRTENDKTILAQGIAQRLYFNRDSNLYVPMPFTGQDNPLGDFSSYATISSDRFAFYSPETIFGISNLVRAKSIKPIIRMSGKSYGIADKRTDGRGNKYAHTLLNYTKYTSFNGSAVSLDSGATEEIPSDDQTNLPYAGKADKSYSTREVNGYYSMMANSAFPKYGNYGEDISTNDLHYADGSGTDTIFYRQANGSASNQNDANNQGVTDRYLYNILSDSTIIYGTVNDAEYIYVAHSTTSNNGVYSIEAYSGDTFISKIAIMSTMSEITNQALDMGIRFRTLNYFFVESTINANYRHYLSSQGSIEGTLPYYPKVSKLWVDTQDGVFQYPPYLGHSKGYNKQYSIENKLNIFYPKLIGESEEVSDFSNRTIYSSIAVEGEQLDSYRIFLPNNYHDIPKNKGEITDLFNLNGSLYHHTSRSLYKSFMNENTTQASSSGEVYLGNGGLFPRPSMEIFDIKGGYAGTLNKRSSINSPFGRFFVDHTQEKVFLFSQGLEEISDQGLFNFFKSNINDGATMISVYDYDNKRWILSSTLTNLPSPYNERYKGQYKNDQEFIASLVSGDVVYKDGKYKIVL